MSEQVSRSEFERLAETVAETAEAVHELVPIVKLNVQAVAKQTDNINNISERLAQLSAPKGVGSATIIAVITAIIGFGALSLSVTVAIGTLALWPLQTGLAKQEAYTSEMDQMFIEHIRDGHPMSIMNSFASLEAQVKANEAERIRESQVTIESIHRELTARETHIRDLIDTLDRRLKEVIEWNQNK